ncbi:MAG: glycoside hydrolase family 3 C-terminal domain-containing protein [Eubacteriales bacterium]|nr:glycoside hydrolase family 3 C-terminal domain-containing protein [Eubacteriales bacterium]
MTREEARKKAEQLVDQMTVEEMTTQLRYDAKAIERLQVPEYNWWGEALHGVARAGSATVFPQAIGMAASFDEEMIEQVGEIVSTEARAKYNLYVSEGDRDIYKGLTVWSPNVNIFRDPRWGRGHETYGEDPFLSGKLGTAYVKGLQGDGEHLRTAACAKHFAVHSGPEAERHHFDAKVNKKDLHETYLPAFEMCVKEGGVEAVMGAYNRTNGEPCCAHTELMENILRKDWKFQGHYVSDCWAIKDFHENHMVTRNPRQSVALAMSKGCDVNCGSTYLCMMQAYKERLITKKQIRTATVRLFTTRYLLGLFDGSEYDSVPYSEVESREHLAYARQAAEKSIVLLKNDGILPLSKEKLAQGEHKAVAVIGPNANSRAALIGNYHGTASRYTTILEGLQDALEDSDVRVYYSEGCHLFKDRVEHLGRPDDRIAEAVGIARRSDLVILCVGLDETLEGEEGDTGNSYASGDKVDLQLPESQRHLVEALKKAGKPIILLNVTGSAMDLNYAKQDPLFAAVLQTWYPGAEGGKAIADILLGAVSPSGKLPVTFYNSLEELPAFEDYSMQGRTYRYMEHAAQYPFGYGLSYGQVETTGAAFAAEDLENVRKALEENDLAFFEKEQLTVKAELKNAGTIDTDEVVQVYVRVPDSAFAPRNHSLCGIKRVSVKAAEEKTVEVKVPARAFLVYNEEGKRVLDTKRFIFYVGTSQPDPVSTELTGKQPVEIEIEA